ncbi:MAG TPA: ABC transporter permease subunit, partial [Acidimicrobiales bacterium]|nr:ABC transporter permease subunit [Acidimicrobiales bacterium]
MANLTLAPSGAVDAARAPGRDESSWRGPRRVPIGAISIWTVLTLLIIAPVGCFLLLAVSPRLFGQGPQWFTLTYVRQAFAGNTGQGIFNSLWVSATVAIVSVSLATALAWLIHRTNVWGRRLWAVTMWVLLLMPTWMMTLGWQDLLEPYGAAHAAGIDTNWVYGEFFGPLGIVIVLTAAALPFAYFIVAAGLQGLGPEYEDAARIHGGGRVRTAATVLPMIAPALFSALAISFAETISDFGVADTLGYHAHFPLATFTLYSAISNFPANFSVAAVIAVVLILSTVPPIALQSRVMRRSKSYAILSGRTRVPRRREFTPRGRVLASVGIGVVMAVALGVPVLGAVAGSFVQNLGDAVGPSVHFTLTYYRQAFNPSIVNNGLGSPLLLSNQLGLVVATLTGVLAVVLARRLIASHGGWSQRLTDVFLLGTVAIPGVVLGVGYIFFYNLPFISNNVVNIYKTLPLLMLALVANAVPGQTRFLAGPVSQLQ